MHKKILFLLVILFVGCTESVDFDKWDDVEIDATYISTLIFLDLTASSFLNESDEEILFLSDLVEIPISDDLEPYIQKIEFTIITSNSFDRGFELKFDLYDALSNSIYTIQPAVHVAANTETQTFLLTIPESDIDVIYDMNAIGAQIVLNASGIGGKLNGTENFNFVLKSSMKIYVKY